MDAHPSHAALCVLASGSRGNCSAVCFEHSGRRRLALIDLGLSPRRTRILLRDLGASLDEVSDVLVTHLDHDHFHEGWIAALPSHVTLRVHRRHRSFAQRVGALYRRTEIFADDPFDLFDGAVAHATIVHHDEQGAAAFRFDLAGASLGYATDLGRITDALIAHLSGVDVLAVESNYCPRLQVASARPPYLKRRIMGGSGHLSNKESAELARAVRPREHAVLLHLSQECNRPALALAQHEPADWTVTVSAQDAPTPWIPIRTGPRTEVTIPQPPQFSLFS